MRCAATTTIRAALWDEYREHEALAALASLEQLVEAAQRVDDLAPTMPAFIDDYDFGPAALALHDALAAVGPGEEPAQ